MNWHPLVLLGEVIKDTRKKKPFFVTCRGRTFRCDTYEEARDKQIEICLESPAIYSWRKDLNGIYELRFQSGGSDCILLLDEVESLKHHKLHKLSDERIQITDKTGCTIFLFEFILTARNVQVKFVNDNHFDFRKINLEIVPPEAEQVLRKRQKSDNAKFANSVNVVDNGELSLSFDQFQIWREMPLWPRELAEFTKNVDVAKCRTLSEQQRSDHFQIVCNTTQELGQHSHTSGIELLNQFMLRAMLTGRNSKYVSLLSSWGNLSWRMKFWEKFASRIHTIEKRAKSITNSTIRQCFAENHARLYNFPPTIAKRIYERFMPLEGWTLDLCAGFGGRLLGFFTSNHGSNYVGYDPNSLLIQPYQELISFLRSQNQSKSVQIKHKPAEELNEKPNSFDLVFTSPPYFDLELYNTESTQSCIRYPTYTTWLNEFLFVILRKGVESLKDDGYLAINIKSSTKNDIVRDMHNYVLNVLGIVELPAIDLVQGNLPFASDTTHEQIYIFQKSNNK
jgi:hypothetical protein